MSNQSTSQSNARAESLDLLRRIAEGIERLLEISSQTHEASVTTAEALARLGQALSSLQPEASVVAAPQPAGEYRVITAEALIMTYTDNGEPAYKIIGQPYSKFGVRVWPEILPTLGVNPSQLKPGRNPYNAAVLVLMGERGPKKVIGLAKKVAELNVKLEPGEEPPF